jgi:hypothetical protein
MVIMKPQPQPQRFQLLMVIMKPQPQRFQLLMVIMKPQPQPQRFQLLMVIMKPQPQPQPQHFQQTLLNSLLCRVCCWSS